MRENLKDKKCFRVGVISDTHGYLNPGIAGTFQGVDLIVHAGDIGKVDVLEKLRRIAPVHAVRGNMDHGDWARKLPRTQIVEAGKVLLYLLHDLTRLDLVPSTAGLHAVISGHTHRARVQERNGVLLLNPGSATFPRFDASGSVALLRIEGINLEVRLVDL